MRLTLSTALIMMSGAAYAGVIPVTNPQFGEFPPGQTAATYLNLTNCGNPGCRYTDNATFGWNNSVVGVGTGSVEGQWQIGNLPATGSFNADPVPGENIVLRAINAHTDQIVSATALAGVTYTLDIALGFMTSQNNNGTIDLIVGGHTVLGTPVGSETQAQMQRTGNWFDFQAQYTATAADAGDPIEILMGATNGQWGMFGNVRLSDNASITPGAPEPATWVLILIGFGLVAAFRVPLPRPH